MPFHSKVEDSNDLHLVLGHLPSPAPYSTSHSSHLQALVVRAPVGNHERDLLLARTRRHTALPVGPYYCGGCFSRGCCSVTTGNRIRSKGQYRGGWGGGSLCTCPLCSFFVRCESAKATVSDLLRMSAPKLRRKRVALPILRAVFQLGAVGALVCARGATANQQLAGVGGV